MEAINWYALYTKSRHEKLIKRELDKRCIQSFLPTRKIRKNWSDRKITVEEPLFKSYLFVKTDYLKKNDVLKVKGAVTFIKAGTKPVPISEKTISTLRSIVHHEIAADPFPYLDKGDRVCINSGPFKGMEGYVARKDDKKCRVVVSIEAIKSSISIEVDSYLVEKI